MPLILINKRQTKALGKTWGEPHNGDTAHMKRQELRVFNVSKADMKKVFGDREGVTCTRESFKSKRSYKAFPDAKSPAKSRVRGRYYRRTLEDLDTAVPSLFDISVREIMRTGDMKDFPEVLQSQMSSQYMADEHWAKGCVDILSTPKKWQSTPLERILQCLFMYARSYEGVYDEDEEAVPVFEAFPDFIGDREEFPGMAREVVRRQTP